ncbi:hypothetical protein Ct9H90mP29_01420 [bacterium]|nr:MAG: hypothetical protein Ct9H90mP29_01420 [bacterium]
MYYGYNVAESWLSRIQNSPNGEWHASTMARVNTHNTKLKNGIYFGIHMLLTLQGTYPLLAHSAFSDTWPERYKKRLGPMNHFGLAGGPKTIISLFLVVSVKKRPDCWEEVEGLFISEWRSIGKF